MHTKRQCGLHLQKVFCRQALTPVCYVHPSGEISTHSTWEGAIADVREWPNRRMGNEKVVQVSARVPTICVLPLSKTSFMCQPM